MNSNLELQGSDKAPGSGTRDVAPNALLHLQILHMLRTCLLLQQPLQLQVAPISTTVTVPSTADGNSKKGGEMQDQISSKTNIPSLKRKAPEGPEVITSLISIYTLFAYYLFFSFICSFFNAS